jgi:hypothetical protein
MKYSYQLLLEPRLEFDNMNCFHEGLAAVKSKDHWGFIDKTGSIVIPLEYEQAHCFNEGAAVVKKDGKWSYINKLNIELTQLEYDQIYSFKNGLAVVKRKDKYGFIDKTGDVVIPLEYDLANSFNEGLAPAMKNGKYGYIDQAGKTIIPFELPYTYADCFCDGLAKVMIGVRNSPPSDCIDDKYIEWMTARLYNRWGFIDKAGNPVIPLEYGDVRPFSRDLR